MQFELLVLLASTSKGISMEPEADDGCGAVVDDVTCAGKADVNGEETIPAATAVRCSTSVVPSGMAALSGTTTPARSVLIVR